MFDIGFLEILVILIIALMVIGPERMPEVARKLGSFIGRTRRFIDAIKQDGEFQQAVNEIKDAVDFEEQKKELTSLSQNLQSDLTEAAQSIEPLDFSDLERPFGAPEATEPSQFRKAPAMPEPPKSASPETQASAAKQGKKEVNEKPSSTEVPVVSAEAIQQQANPKAETIASSAPQGMGHNSASTERT